MRHVKLVECAKILYGYPFDSSLFTEDDSYIPLIRIRDVMPGVASTYYTGEILSDYLIKAEDILVGMDGNFNLAKWKDRDGLLNQRTLKISAKDDLCINGYLYHLLGPIFKQIELNTAGGSVKHLSAKTINSIEIPLPPLPIQQEIVRILDSFTSMITNLETELASRQKQYEYYRNKLLSFDENDESVEWKTLEALGQSFNGLTGKSKKDFENGNSIFVTYSNIFNNPELNMDISERVRISEGEKQNIIQEGDILFTGSSETPDEAGMSSVVLKKPNSDMFLNSFCFGLRLDNFDIVRPNYMKYVLRSQRIRNKISKTAFGVTRYNINKDKFFRVKIPIPSLKRQQEIVSTLDTFESLITNIKQELEARKKQYEYYREQLLTFE